MLSHTSVTTMLPVRTWRAHAFSRAVWAWSLAACAPTGKFVYQVGGSTLALFPCPAATRPTTRPSAFGCRTSWRPLPG